MSYYVLLKFLREGATVLSPICTYTNMQYMFVPIKLLGMTIRVTINSFRRTTIISLHVPILSLAQARNNVFLPDYPWNIAER